MATIRQIEANRRNAKRSTGPRTEKGKSTSRLNALKHGLTAALVVMPGEDYTAYQELRGSLLTSYQPANPQEQMLVEQLASAYWRGRRARALETRSFDLQAATVERRNKRKPSHKQDRIGALAIAMSVEPQEAFTVLFRYDAAIERAFFRNLQQLREAASSAPPPGARNRRPGHSRPQPHRRRSLF